MNDRTRTVIVYIVAIVWSSNFLASAFLPGYQPAESINAIFLVVVGSLFALHGASRPPDKRKRDDDDVPS